MKLDRNLNPDGKGKYALIKLRGLPLPLPCSPPTETDPGGVWVPVPAIDFGDDPETEFFVIRLKDRFAGPALRCYAHAISDFLAGLPENDPKREELWEYHHEIIRLAEAAHRNPHQRIPD